MFNRPATCTSCNNPLDRNAKFCPQCGTPQAGGTITCGSCRTEIAANSQFCPNCGVDVANNQAPQLKDNRWMRQAGDLAARFDTHDVVGFFSSPLIVEPSTKALILADGRNAGVVGPGSYNLDTLGEKLSRAVKLRAVNQMTAVVVYDEPFDVTINVGDIYTKDPFKVGVDVQLQLQVIDPLHFFETQVGSQTSLSTAVIHSLIANQVQNTAVRWLSKKEVKEIAEENELPVELGTAIEQAIQQTLSQAGLKLIQLRTFNYHTQQLEEITALNEEYLLRVTRLDAEIAGIKTTAVAELTKEELLERTKLNRRRTLFEVVKEDDLQDLAERVHEVQMFEQRAAVRQRMREAVRSDKFNELKDQRQMEEFLREQDEGKLLSDDEWQRMQRTFDWRNNDELMAREQSLADRTWARQIELSDRERDRAHVLARLDLEQQYELDRLDLLQRADLEPDQLKHELEMVRARLEGEQAIEVKKQEFELAQQQQRRAVEREQKELDELSQQASTLRTTQTELEARLMDAKTEAEIMTLQREQDEADGELGILLLEKMKAVRRKDEQERILMEMDRQARQMEIDLQAEEKRLEMELRRQQTSAEIERQREEQRQQFELDWLGQLKGMAPAELVVAARETERAEVIRDMQRTEALRGMSEQQILAMMAENSPEAAQALAEVARAAGEGRLAEERKEFYERLLTQNEKLADQRKEETDRLERLFQDTTGRMQAMSDKALDSQGKTAVDIARATSHPPTQPPSPTIVMGTPGMAGSTIVAGGQPTSGGVMRCPKCSELVPAEANFCPNCRHQMRGV